MFEEQPALDLGGLAFTRPTAKIERDDSRRSIHRMVELALRRGYATSIGDLLDQVALYRQSNPYNGLLAVLQRPHAKFLLTDEEWDLKWGRRLRPNEHPIVVLDPYGPVKFVFDVSQTEPSLSARALPTVVENPFAMKDVQLADVALSWLKENAKYDGVRVSEARHGWKSAGCIWRAEPGLVQSVAWGGTRREMRDVPVRFETLLNASYNPTEKLATLAHELGHLYCGHQDASRADWWPTRRPPTEAEREFEAESVARLVFRRVAPEANLPPHLEQYFGPQDAVPEAGWMHVVSAASRIIDMCQRYSPRKNA